MSTMTNGSMAVCPSNQAFGSLPWGTESHSQSISQASSCLPTQVVPWKNPLHFTSFYLNTCQGDSGELWRTAGWEASAVVMLCYDSNSCTPSQKHWNQTLQSAGWPACKQSSRESSSSSCASGNVALGNLPGILDLGILHLIFQHLDGPGQNRRVWRQFIPLMVLSVLTHRHT